MCVLQLSTVLSVLLMPSLFALFPAQPVDDGVEVTSVLSDSPAARAGVRPGDRIVAFDGIQTRSPLELRISANKPAKLGEHILKLIRGKEIKTTSIKTSDFDELELVFDQLGIEVVPFMAPATCALYTSGLEADEQRETINKWLQAVESAKQTGNVIGASWLYRRIGDSFKGVRDGRQAAIYYSRSSETLDGSDYHADRFFMREQLGNLAVNRRQYGEAYKLYLVCFSECQDQGFVRAMVRLQLKLGRNAKRTSDFSTARSHFQNALERSEREPGMSRRVAETLKELGLLEHDVGRFRLALGYIEREVKIRLTSEGETADVINCYARAGNAHQALGDLDETEKFRRLQLDSAKQVAPGTLEVANALVNLASTAGGLRGDRRLARSYLLQALEICEQVAPKSLDSAYILNNLGAMAHQSGEMDAAYYHLTQAAALLDNLDTDQYGAAVVRLNLSSIDLIRGDVAAAEENLQRYLSFVEQRATRSMEVVQGLIQKGIISRRKKEFEASLEELSRANEILSEIAPNSVFGANILEESAHSLRASGRNVEARKAFEEAVRIRRSMSPDSLALAGILRNFSSLEMQDGKLRSALKLAQEAVKIVESQQGEFETAEARSRMYGTYFGAYSALLKSQLLLGLEEESFSTVERSRARSFVELITEGNIDLLRGASEELQLTHESLMKSRQSAYERLTASQLAQDETVISDIHDELKQLQVRQRELEARIRIASPEVAAIAYPQPLDYRGAWQQLAPGTLSLSYFVGNKETFLYVIDAEDSTALEVHRIAVDGYDLADRVNAFRASVIERKATFQALGHELFDLLMGPVKQRIDKAQRLLISPDGPLHALPFAALAVESRPTSPVYMIDVCPIHLSTSMTSLAHIRERPRSSGDAPRLVAFGDPYYGGGSPKFDSLRGLVLAPADSSEKSLPNRPQDVKENASWNLAPLPGTREEVEQISDHFGPQSVVRLGEEASKAEVLEFAGQADILHFACHGLLDDRDPLASGLALSVPSNHSEQGGVLHAWEVMQQLKLKADLVVLSACETGLGKTTKHEGVVGLTRAFQYAGARSVLVSLWSVSDASTPALMSEFYRQLQNGLSKDEALRSAMRFVKSQPSWDQPFHWAPFTLHGPPN